MNRVTNRDEHGRAWVNQGWTHSGVFNRLAAYEDTGLEPEEIKNSLTDAVDLAKVAMALRKLRNYEDAERTGRLVVLPCKVGDTVYICSDVRGIRSEKVRTFFIGHPSYRVEDKGLQMIRTETCDIPFSEFGKKAFLTREEAVRALEVSHE